MINQSKISTMAGRRLLVAMALALALLQTCAPAVDAAPQRPPRTAPTAQDGGRGSTGHEDTTPAATATPRPANGCWQGRYVRSDNCDPARRPSAPMTTRR